MAVQDLQTLLEQTSAALVASQARLKETHAGSTGTDTTTDTDNSSYANQIRELKASTVWLGGWWRGKGRQVVVVTVVVGCWLTLVEKWGQCAQQPGKHNVCHGQWRLCQRTGLLHLFQALTIHIQALRV